MNAIDSLWVVLPVKTTLLLTLAWVIHVALARFNPRWRVLLWRTAACGMVLVAVWSFGLPRMEVGVPISEMASVAPVFTSPPVGAEEIAVEPIPPEAVALPEASVPVESTPMVASHTINTAPVVNVPTETSMADAAMISWQNILILIWSFGIAAFALRLAVGHLRLSRHLVRSCTPAPETIFTEVRRVAAELGCRREVRVFQSPKFTIPFIFGPFRPVLVLPEKMCHADYRSRLPSILAHELAHVRSGDFVWNLILQAVSIPLWFHPLAWRIASAHRSACDAVCDAVSVSYLGDVRSYCRTLAKVALEDAASATFPAVGLAMARRCDVRRRVAALERAVFTTPLRRRAVAATVLVGLIAAVLLAGVKLTRAERKVEDKPKAESRESSGDAKDSGSSSLEAAAAAGPSDGGKEPTETPLGTSVTISGRVVLAMSDEEKKICVIPPVKKFRVKAGYERVAGSGDVFWRESWAVEDEKGEYRIVWNTREKGRRAVRIEAEGYLSTEPLFVDADKKEAALDFSLARGRDVSGIVRAPDGTPVRDAEVAPCLPHVDLGELYIRDGHLDRSFVNWSIRTDSEGRFSFGSLSSQISGSLVSPGARISINATTSHLILFVVHNEGVAEVEVMPDSQELNITLLPWARAEGTLRIAGKPAAGERVCLYLREMPPVKRPLSRYDSARGRITFDYATQTDAEGRFVFERVFPAEGRVVRCAVQKQGLVETTIPTHSAKATFAPGKTTRVDIQRDGRPVTGEFGIADASLDPPNYQYASALLAPPYPPQPGIPWPRRLVERKDDKALLRWLVNWKKTPEGRAYQETMARLEVEWQAASFATNVKPDGSFRFDDIPPGTYELRLRLQAPPKEGEFFPSEVIAEGIRSVTVPKMPNGPSDEPFNSGGAMVEPVKQ